MTKISQFCKHKRWSRKPLLVATWLMVTLLLLARVPDLRAETMVLGDQLCTLWKNLSGNDLVDVSGTSGDPLLDKQLALEAQRIADLFDIHPGLKIATAPAGYANNALADPKTIVPGTNGTVVLGHDLVYTELQKNRRGWGGLTVAGFMAHEFAHIYQFSTKYRKLLMEGSPTVMPVELHADFLAGYYLGVKRREGSKADIGAFTDGIYIVGDNLVTDKGHHGRSAERRAAVIRGYKTGIQRGRLPISEIADIGVTVVQKLTQ